MMAYQMYASDSYNVTRGASNDNENEPVTTSHINLLVPDIHCAACIQKIEKTLNNTKGILSARVNLSTKRISIEWYDNKLKKENILKTIENLGFKVQDVSDEDLFSKSKDESGQQLLKCLAISGFAAANIMLLSVSVWSGAQETTRQLFHWFSAMIALPTVIYCGQPFYRSALNALRNYQMNMDVPISLAVILAAAISLYETINNSAHAYFDASVMLLFFLLIGRYLDHMMRERAKSAISHLFSLQTNSARIVEENGDHRLYPYHALRTGMKVSVAAGERIPVDGEIIQGTSDIDTSMVTGESEPKVAYVGSKVFSGTMNLTGPLEIKITALGSDTLLSEMIKCMENAEANKSKYIKLSKKAANIYAPAVHILALLCFIAWMVLTNGNWHTSLITAISVLIITCPCALGLAVPVVQIVASGVLFRNGIMLKDGTALEKLAQIDSVLFDKTGTLTLGKAKLISAKYLSGREPDKSNFSIAAGLAIKSQHPLSKALQSSQMLNDIIPERIDNIREIPGYGVEGYFKGKMVRLGSRYWCEQEAPENKEAQTIQYLELCLKVEGKELLVFHFEDCLRPNAESVIEKLEKKSIDVGILSGDREQAVKYIAKKLNIKNWWGNLKPQDKVKQINAFTNDSEKKVLVVGDGINDAPALATGFASMAPASASDIGRTASNFVFMGDSLKPVSFAHDIAKKSKSLILQNFMLALVYNMIAVPIAFLGYASPLVAAIAMSSSSILVTLNALRLQFYHMEKTDE